MSNLMEKYGLKPGDFIICKPIETLPGDPAIWTPEQIFSENDDSLYVLGGA